MTDLWPMLGRRSAHHYSLVEQNASPGFTTARGKGSSRPRRLWGLNIGGIYPDHEAVHSDLLSLALEAGWALAAPLLPPLTGGSRTAKFALKAVVARGFARRSPIITKRKNGRAPLSALSIPKQTGWVGRAGASTANGRSACSGRPDRAGGKRRRKDQAAGDSRRTEGDRFASHSDPESRPPFGKTRQDPHARRTRKELCAPSSKGTGRPDQWSIRGQWRARQPRSWAGRGGRDPSLNERVDLTLPRFAGGHRPAPKRRTRSRPLDCCARLGGPITPRGGDRRHFSIGTRGRATAFIHTYGHRFLPAGPVSGQPCAPLGLVLLLRRPKARVPPEGETTDDKGRARLSWPWRRPIGDHHIACLNDGIIGGPGEQQPTPGRGHWHVYGQYLPKNFVRDQGQLQNRL